MKRIALLLTLLVLAFGSPARAAVSTTNFVALRAALVTELNTASNTVPVDKKLVATLKKSLAVIDKPGVTNLVNDTKVLTLLTPLTKTSLSNTFNPLLNNSLQDFLNVFFAAAANSSNNLAGTFPSGLHTAAGNKLGTLYAQLLNADNLADLIAAAKQLAAAAKTLGVVNALVDKAQHAPLPKANVTATVSGAVHWSFKSAVAVFDQTAPGNGFVNNIQPGGGGFRTVDFTLYGMVAGPNTLVVGPGAGETEILIIEASFSGNSTTWHGKSGTVNVNYDPATKVIVGTFSAICEDDDNASRHITVNASFSAKGL